MKVALVTGAYKGLGLEFCRQLADNGYTVILTARSVEKAEESARELREEFGHVVSYALDVTDEQQIMQLAEWVEQNFGHVDVLINNAGINSKDDADKELFQKSFRLETLDPEEVVRHIRINSIAPIMMVKHFRSLLHRSEKPVVISISSWLGSISGKDFGGHYSYATSKTALNMMNKAMALEIKPEGIIAVVVNPGWVQTDMGGSKAPLTPEESVRGILQNVIKRVRIADTGKFYQWDGSEMAW
jgi:NAD(P)-dependent dehydrogenase (short-subunit alcohol dehydrogenase family)